MNVIKKATNTFTMSFMMKSYLAVVLVFALAMSAFGLLPYDALDIFMVSAYLVLVCVALNAALSRLFKADASIDSPIITATILALVVGPLPLTSNLLLFSFLAVVAMASKYLVVVHLKHIFNPAAFAVVASYLVLGQGASWWVGSSLLLPVVAVGAVFMIQKLRLWHMVTAFLVVYLGLTAVVLVSQGVALSNLSGVFRSLILYSPLLFFASVMLVEPLTSPKKLRPQILYAVFIAITLVFAHRLLNITYSLELSLLAGNVLSGIIDRSRRYKFSCRSSKQEVKGVKSFWFDKPADFNFRAGQFMEWSLPHPHSDKRGNRRWFTLASSPTESQVMLASRFSTPSSSFKRALNELESGGSITATGPAGDFTLPRNPRSPMVWIAGGIGITPFRSMAKYLSDSRQTRDIVLFYSNRDLVSIAFKEFFDEVAAKVNIKLVYSVDQKPSKASGMEHGFVEAAMIKKHAPDFKSRLFYISGPQPMVESLRKTVRQMGVKASNIKTDYFPGYSE